MMCRTSAIAAALLALGAFGARAEIVELTNGSFLQGDVQSARTGEEGLAIELYDTGGVVVVRWDHIVESRRRELRQREGLDLPEESEEMVPGHRVRLTNGEEVVGLAENPQGTDDLRMKTRTGVNGYPRARLAGPVQETPVNGLLVYTRDELYERMRKDDPPATPAAHKALAKRCMNIGAYVRAREHLLAAKEDAAFMGTPEGKAVEPMLRNAELMVRAQGAADLKTQVLQARSAGRWNEARKLLEQLASAPEYKDPQIRNAIGFDLLEARILKGRDTYFQKQIALSVYRTMDQLVADKARESRPQHVETDAPKNVATQGTLAAARKWSGRDLYDALWTKVGADLGLEKAELERYWKERSSRTIRRTSYGTGTFVAVKRSATQRQGGAKPPPQRRAPTGSAGGGKNVPAKPVKSQKPLTEEEWWLRSPVSERTRWLTANFVETSGMFEVLKTEQTNCQSCGGEGATTVLSTAGGEDRQLCAQCNGAGVERKVSYR